MSWVSAPKFSPSVFGENFTSESYRRGQHLVGCRQCEDRFLRLMVEILHHPKYVQYIAIVPGFLQHPIHTIYHNA